MVMFQPVGRQAGFECTATELVEEVVAEDDEQRRERDPKRSL